MGSLVKMPLSEVTATLESLEQHGVTAEGLKEVRKDAALAAKIALHIMVSMRKVYTVTLDFIRPLSEAIKACNFDFNCCDYENPEIVDGHFFGIRGFGMQTADLMLITVKEVIEWLISQGQEIERDKICKWYIVPTKQILAYMIEQGCSPACDIWQLLAFSAAKFDVNQESSVHILGYENMTKDGFHPCPSLNTYNGKRGLDLDWYSDDRCWREDDCFLAVVRKAV